MQSDPRKPKAAHLSVLALFAIAACAGTPAPKQDPQDIARALALYSQGWATRDAQAILDRHSDNTEFHLVMWGSDPAHGKDEVRAAFDAILASNPGYTSFVRRVRLGEDFAVVEYDMLVDPDLPARAGASVFTPSGTPYLTPAVDIIVFEDGKVIQKITYLDTETIRAHSLRVEAAE